MIQVGSCKRYLASHLVARKTGVTGDPLKAQMGSSISEITQPLPDPVHHDVCLSTTTSVCAAGPSLNHPSADCGSVQIRTSLGAGSAAASCRKTRALFRAVISAR